MFEAESNRVMKIKFLKFCVADGDRHSKMLWTQHSSVLMQAYMKITPVALGAPPPPVVSSFNRPVQYSATIKNIVDTNIPGLFPLNIPSVRELNCGDKYYCTAIIVWRISICRPHVIVPWIAVTCVGW
jgi:hypothetical protein